MKIAFLSVPLLIVSIALPAFSRGVPQAPQAQANPHSALEQTLISAEKSLVDAFQRGDLAYLRNAIDDGFYAIATSGDSYGKADLLDSFHPGRAESKEKPIFYFFQVVPLNDGAAVVTYDAVFPGQRPRYQHLSNTWVKQGEQWKLKFQQSTPNLWSANDF
jgi:hypothetical protein